VSLAAKHSPQEFRQYRKLVSWTILFIIAFGSVYLLVSVGVGLYRHRHAIPAGDQVSATVSQAEMSGCYQELRDIAVALRKYLERSHHLLASENAEEMQRWADEGEVWRAQWLSLGKRCRLTDGLRAGPQRREMETMAAAHQEMGSIRNTYTEALKRFAKDLAPRLGRLDKRLTKVGEALATAVPPSGDKK
jgi:hypothetical protein